MELETLDMVASYSILLIPLVTFAGMVGYALWRGL